MASPQKTQPSEPPSICFVGLDNLPVLAPEFDRLPIGGAQVQQVLLAKGLTRRGFVVSMVVADHGQPDGQIWSEIRTFKAYHPDDGLPGLRFLTPRWTGVWAALKRSGAVIRYSSCASLHTGLITCYTRRHPGHSVFRIAHDTDCHPDQLLIPNWHGKAIYRYGLRRTNLILAQTTRQQLLMQTQFGLDSLFIPSLVATPSHYSARQNRSMRAVWIGNLRPFKRPHLALTLATLIPEIELHIVGGRQPHEEYCYEKAWERAKTIPSVRFHGQIPAERANQLMDHSYVLINTSEREGFPNTFLQAWIRGTPVVSFFDPDGVITREGLGFVVSTLPEMRDAVRALLVDASLWNAISARCRTYASRTHGDSAIDQYAEALLALRDQQGGSES